MVLSLTIQIRLVKYWTRVLQVATLENTLVNSYTIFSRDCLTYLNGLHIFMSCS